MKTFRELKYGDYIAVKNQPKWVQCNVVIDGHHYVTELVEEDVFERIITSPGEKEPIAGKIIIFHTFNEKTCKDNERVIFVEDLDKSENESFKVISC